MVPERKQGLKPLYPGVCVLNLRGSVKHIKFSLPKSLRFQNTMVIKTLHILYFGFCSLVSELLCFVFPASNEKLISAKTKKEV